MVSDLRAIPWVFAWTQNRCLLPAWYGLGTALADIQQHDAEAWKLVGQLYREWPFFQAAIDNAALALAKSDMYIGQHYAKLATSAEGSQHIWQLIADEYARSRQAVIDIVGGDELLSNTRWFQNSIEARNPYIDPLNLIQIDWLKRRMELPPDAPPEQLQQFSDLLRLTVQGIAAGMRTTG